MNRLNLDQKQSVERKNDHLEMASSSQTKSHTIDGRFYYEPLLSAHPMLENTASYDFCGHKFLFPLWISSMTGGAFHAKELNQNMARVCEEFSLGMGLGSCRPLLDSDELFDDFNVRKFMPTRPLFANIGIGQLEQLQKQNDQDKILRAIDKLKADGLIIHINPLQEWFQDGGDEFKQSPLKTICDFLNKNECPVIVKEVGHGMGPESLKELMKLPLMAIEFAAFGGTNFSVIEMKRKTLTRGGDGLSYIGHSAEEMISFVNAILKTENEIKCNRFIISGGVKDSLTGYYLTQNIAGQSLYGMAHSVLQAARQGYPQLHQFVKKEYESYSMAKSFLRARPIYQEGSL